MSNLVRQERYDNLDLDLECEGGGGGGVAVSNRFTAGSHREANWALASIYVAVLWQPTLKWPRWAFKNVTSDQTELTNSPRQIERLHSRVCTAVAGCSCVLPKLFYFSIMVTSWSCYVYNIFGSFSGPTLRPVQLVSETHPPCTLNLTLLNAQYFREPFAVRKVFGCYYYYYYSDVND